MIEIRTYTKEELAEELGVSCKRDGDIRADKIVDKLRRDKFYFTTSGKGKNYRINITGLPQTRFLNFGIFIISRLTAISMHTRSITGTIPDNRG